MVQAQGYYPDRLVQPRAGQAYCGLPVPRPRSPLGVDPPLPGHGHYFPNARSPLRGSVCVGTLCPAPEVLCAGSGSGSVANRAFSVRWEVFTGYVFPPTHPPNSTEGEAGSGYRPPHCPVVAEENVVPRNDNPSSGVSENPPRSQGHDIPADTGDPAPKAVRPPPDCLALVREAGAQAGFSERLRPLLPAADGILPERRTFPSCRIFQLVRISGGGSPFGTSDGRGRFLSSLFDKGRLVF